MDRNLREDFSSISYYCNINIRELPNMTVTNIIIRKLAYMTVSDIIIRDLTNITVKISLFVS